MKLTKKQQADVSAFAIAYMRGELKANGRFTFQALRAVILAKWPGAEFNWMIVVRSPMQVLINEGAMVRDSSDMLGPELYVRAGA